MGDRINIFFSPTRDQIWQRLSTQSYEPSPTKVFHPTQLLQSKLGSQVKPSLPGRTENPAVLQHGLTATVQTMYLCVYPIFNHLDSNSG